MTTFEQELAELRIAVRQMSVEDLINQRVFYFTYLAKLKELAGSVYAEKDDAANVERWEILLDVVKGELDRRNVKDVSLL